MSFQEYMNEVEEPEFRIGDIVLGKAFLVDPSEGIYVRFGGPGDGFVPLDELTMANTNPDFGFEYAPDVTYWLEIVDLDNSSKPILLSEKKALRTMEGDGTDPRGIRGEYSHYTSNGAAKQPFPNRELAVQRIQEIQSSETNARLAPYMCRSCIYWHIGNDG